LSNLANGSVLGRTQGILEVGYQLIFGLCLEREHGTIMTAFFAFDLFALSMVTVYVEHQNFIVW
jgi:hypothetical protein